jgi:putative drug exporter of the RND superfamily
VLRRVQDKLTSDPAVTRVIPPRTGVSISPDRHAAVIQAGAARDANDMVRAADELKGPLARLGSSGVRVDLTGAPGMWSDFNQANKAAMMKSELISWPVTLAILVLAFGSLVAAGLPLMLTIAGLVAAAGSLWIGTRIADISIWSMNFALMFALALGIDYALFIVYRFRGAFFGSRLSAEEAVAATMDTAGRAVLFSGVTVLISLSAVMLVPSPAFRSTSLGIMLSVVFVLAAALTLLPAALAKLGPRVDRFALPWVDRGEQHSPRSAAWGERLWRHPLRYGLAALAILVVLALPVLSLKTAMPSIKVVPSGDSSRQGYEAVQKAFGPGSTGPLQIVAPRAQAAQAAAAARRDPGVARVMPALAGVGDMALVQAIPTTAPSAAATGATVDRLRAALPPAALLGGPVAESHDLQATLSAKTPLVIGVVLGLSFLLLMVALQAPVIALLGVVTNLLATAAAFGVAKWIFQDGVGHSVLGFEPQGFLDAWGPVFFFAMIFAISMDYTVFLLSSAKEHWERSGGDAKAAMVGGMASSGRVISAAGAIMVAVFVTFALSGPLPPKEMGVILGVAVLLDAALVRLLLLPVLLRLLGRWAWYLPKPLHRLLPEVRFGHA